MAGVPRLITPVMFCAYVRGGGGGMLATQVLFYCYFTSFLTVLSLLAEKPCYSPVSSWQRVKG